MEIKDNIERMKDGRLYDPADPAVMGEQLGYLDLLAEYNALRPSDVEHTKRNKGQPVIRHKNSRIFR